MAEPSNDVLNHVIDLSHLITDGKMSWDKFQLVGLSGQDSKVYLVAYKANLRQVGLLNGYSLLPNSWKLISRFTVPHFTHIDARITHASFSTNFTQIGIVVRGNLSVHQIGYSFMTFDVTSSEWQHRHFEWPYARFFYFKFRLSQTCVGWIMHPDYIIPNCDTLKNVLQLSFDPVKDSIGNLFEFPQECLDSAAFIYPSNDLLYCFSNHHDRYIYIFHLNRDGFPWERFMVDSGFDHLYFFGSNFTQKFMNTNDVILKADTYQCTPGQRCSFLPNNLHIFKIYEAVVDWSRKHCEIKKITQFIDRSDLVYFESNNNMLTDYVDGLLTKSKRFALFDGWRDHPNIPKLVLETVFFRLPTLKELCSLALIKTFSERSDVVVETPNYVNHSGVIWSGGLTEELKNDFGLNMATLNFGELEP